MAPHTTLQTDATNRHRFRVLQDRRQFAAPLSATLGVTLKYPPVRRVLAALIGAVFVVYGFTAVLVAIPHAALLPIIVATAAIVGGVTAVLGFWRSKYLLYFASIAYASSLAMNLFGLIDRGWIGDSTRDYVSAVAPSIAVICALLLSSHLVGRLLKGVADDA